MSLVKSSGTTVINIAVTIISTFGMRTENIECTQIHVYDATLPQMEGAQAQA